MEEHSGTLKANKAWVMVEGAFEDRIAAGEKLESIECEISRSNILLEKCEHREKTMKINSTFTESGIRVLTVDGQTIFVQIQRENARLKTILRGLWQKKLQVQDLIRTIESFRGHFYVRDS